MNFTLYKDGGSVLFAYNDFEASNVENIIRKIFTRRKYSRARGYMQQMRQLGATEILTIMSIYITGSLPMDMGTIELDGNRCGYFLISYLIELPLLRLALHFSTRLQ